MNQKQRDHLEERLLTARSRATRELGNFGESLSSEASGPESELDAYTFHMADQGTDAMEREKAFLFASKEGRLLYHIDEALRRLYRSPENFGKCEHCGGRISFERLDALPHARLCIGCKEKEETNAG